MTGQFKITEAGLVKANEYKGVIEYKQWVTAQNNQNKVRVLAKLQTREALSVGSTVGLNLGEPKTARNGSEYYFGDVISSPQSNFFDKPAANAAKTPSIGAQHNNSLNPRDTSIEKQVCFKGAIELAVAKVIEFDRIADTALSFYDLIFAEKTFKPKKKSEPVPEPIPDDCDDDNFGLDDMPF